MKSSKICIAFLLLYCSVCISKHWPNSIAFFSKLFCSRFLLDAFTYISQSTDTKVVYTALSAEALSRVSALGESLQARASSSSGHGSSLDGSSQTIKVVSLEQAGTVEKKELCAGDERDRTGGPGELNQPSIFPD